MFDGIPAPLLYVSDNQINAVTPSGLASKASTQVCVVFQGSQTNCIYAGIALASPGVFLSGVATNNPTPFAAAVNQDGTVNSAQHPASVGSIVSIYATGLGMITPAPTDGAAISLPLPANVLPVQVLFTDPNFHDPLPLLDTVLYAGPAPFEVVGLTQINVPATAAVTLQVTLPDGTAVQDRMVQIWIK